MWPWVYRSNPLDPKAWPAEHQGNYKQGCKDIPGLVYGTLAYSVGNLREVVQWLHWQAVTNQSDKKLTHHPCHHAQTPRFGPQCRASREPQRHVKWLHSSPSQELPASPCGTYSVSCHAGQLNIVKSTEKSHNVSTANTGNPYVWARKHVHETGLWCANQFILGEEDWHQNEKGMYSHSEVLIVRLACLIFWRVIRESQSFRCPHSKLHCRCLNDCSLRKSCKGVIRPSGDCNSATGKLHTVTIGC